ncbi:MAG: PIN domain-containing protein [Verrucomicrobia bacterium]|nr:PIN domain-containing protein [Verrucomicrobiota bacterium]
MKPTVVLDSSVVVSGIGWTGGDARNALRLLARRAFTSVRSDWLTAEWADATARVAAESRTWTNENWSGWIDWLKRASSWLDDPPRRATLRDPKDDPVLMLAVSSLAKFLVTYDLDFLALGKPFGVQCIRPDAFVAAILKN